MSFSDFNLTDFWEDSEYAKKSYQDVPLTDDMIQAAEIELGYKLPLSYITLMRTRNGGIPKNAAYPMTKATSWAEDHISITGIMGIGRQATYSICGDLGSAFMIDEWGYPDVGVYICTTPTGGHNMVLLDYSKSGKTGEPEVVFIDQEDDYKKTFIAKDFETFIRGLVNDDVFDTSEEELHSALVNIRTGAFSTSLTALIANDKEFDFDKILRKLFIAIATAKGHFALHADPLSALSYDILFYLLSRHQQLKSGEDFFKAYPKLVALPDVGISTNGYSPDFIEEWFDKRISSRKIRKPLFGGLRFSKEYTIQFLAEIKKYE